MAMVGFHICLLNYNSGCRMLLKTCNRLQTASQLLVFSSEACRGGGAPLFKVKHLNLAES